MSPRWIFEQELETLKNQVAEMGERVHASYERLLLAIRERDDEALRALLDNDRQITDMQRGIEAKCLTLLTRQQPVARDLRQVTAALKAVTDLERMGDHVADLAELYLRLGEALEPTGQTSGGGLCEELLSPMLEEVEKMLLQAVEAFSEGDVQRSEEVIGQDDVVDDLFNRVKEAMMEAIRKRAMDADKVVDTLMAAKYLEKIGDHAVNIGEWAIFQATGDMRGVKLY